MGEAEAARTERVFAETDSGLGGPQKGAKDGDERNGEAHQQTVTRSGAKHPNVAQQETAHDAKEDTERKHRPARALSVEIRVPKGALLNLHTETFMLFKRVVVFNSSSEFIVKFSCE